MRVSTIIPCYNTAQFLHESIQSVLAQSTPVDELVVIDDGSTDDSAAIAASFDQVRLIRQPNSGVSAARNRGLAETTGELVIFHDADDRLLPDAVQIGLAAMQARPDSAFVFGFYRPIRADGSPGPRTAPVLRGEVGFADMLRGDALVPPSSALFRRGALSAVGGFRVGMALAEDYDLYLRLSHRFPVHCHNQVVVEYRRHEENASEISACRIFEGTLAALEAQREVVAESAALRSALSHGRRHWAKVFGPGMARETLRLVRRGKLLPAARALALLLRHDPGALPREIRDLIVG